MNERTESVHVEQEQNTTSTSPEQDTNTAPAVPVEPSAVAEQELAPATEQAVSAPEPVGQEPEEQAAEEPGTPEPASTEPTPTSTIGQANATLAAFGKQCRTATDPNYRAAQLATHVDVVLPKRPAMFTVAVNPVLMAELLTALAAIVAEDGGPVQLHFYSGKSAPLGLSCRNAQGQFADGLLVPLT